MKKLYSLVLVSVLFSSNAFAQPTRNWGTYYGGAGDEAGYSTATDASGNVYVAGYTNSATGISTSGSHQQTIGGNYDAFLAKFNSAGVRQWATYYGGTGTDYGLFVTVDASGNVYLSGYSLSATGISSGGSHQPTNGGGGDAFIAKFNSAGVRQWATYYGGTAADYGYCVAVDASFNVYLCGQAVSTTAISTLGSHQQTFGGGIQDAFLVQFNSAGVRQWGTYFGGTGEDQGYGIHIGGSGNIYIGGFTASTNGISTLGSHQTTYGGGIYDGYIAKFSNTGVCQWASYYGGTGSDIGYSVTEDSNGNPYLLGYSVSPAGISTLGSHQPIYGGGAYDAFLVQFNSAGVRQWATYYGGPLLDYGLGAVVDGNNNVYITGQTNSTSAMSSAGSHQPSYGGGTNDAYAVKFNSSGVRQWGTYYGGTGDDVALTITVDGSQNSFLSGYLTSSSGISTTGSHQPAKAANTDAFLVQFNGCAAPAQPGTISGTATICQGSANTYSIAAVSGATSYTWTLPVGWTGTSTTTSINATASATSGNITVTAGNSCGTSAAQTFSVTVNPTPTVTCNSGNTTICNGSSATLNGGGGNTFSWAPGGQTGASISVSPTATTTYTVTGTTSGCSNTSTITITVNTLPTITSTGTGPICAGKTATLTGNGGLTYLWNPGSITGSPVNVNPTTTTTYTVTGTDNNGCSNSSTVTITVNPLPTAPIITQAGTYLQSSAATTYQWYLNGGLIGGAVNQTYTFTANGNYTVIISDVNGCTNTSAIFVVTTTSISNNSNNEVLNIYPNPFSSSITIVSASQNLGEVSIFNILGELIYTSIFAGPKAEIDLAKDPCGVYFMIADNGERIVTKKIIKE